MSEPTGYYVMSWGGGKYGVIAWFKSKTCAEKEVKRLMQRGSWSGKPPKVEPSY